MKSMTDLENLLKSIDHKGYPAYKELRGQYDFRCFLLSIDHVQGDPFAAPSKVSVQVPVEKAGFPEAFLDNRENRITLQDHLTRLFAREISCCNFLAKGSGKSGLISCSACGQEVLERTACKMDEEKIVVRLEVGFPANGRSIQSGELRKILFEFLPGAVEKSLFYKNIDQNALQDVMDLGEDQQFIRQNLPLRNLCAFIADGAVLPRENGVSDKPLKGAVAFQSPDCLRVTLELPHRGRITGMGIPCGVTLLVGGGYHGKSTVLQAIQDGVYNHIGSDGRELVITDASAVKLRAEDGRAVTGVDVSPFINHLPNKKDTGFFTTVDASGSTSQAAGLMEALESGSRLLLLDEDTSATNFMVRDALMKLVIHPAEEPITPFIERVRELYEKQGVSTILVAGSSGDYFDVADTVIQMKEYCPLDITEKVRRISRQYREKQGMPAETFRRQEDQAAKPAIFSWAGEDRRCPKPDRRLGQDDRLKMKTLGKDSLLFGKTTVELRALEQLKDEEQTRALAYILRYLLKNEFDGKTGLGQAVDRLEKLLDQKGLECLFERTETPSGLARPRKQDIMACVSRYRGLQL